MGRDNNNCTRVLQIPRNMQVSSIGFTALTSTQTTNYYPLTGLTNNLTRNKPKLKIL